MRSPYDDGCPRCGGAIDSDPYTCWCANFATCGASWRSAKAYVGECTARDLAGTRASKTPPEWLSQDLPKQLQELVDLVTYQVYGKVQKAIMDSIKGREATAYKIAMGHVVAEAQIDQLRAMQGWIEARMDEVYDEDELDDPF